ncbi:BID domain-containing T4SS effector [Bartonella ancashensis]|uniref:protein adenylyltransferase n=1 Tax=Bartonella ancashensis TaxID=1318743 RepID=A0A0M5KTI0_9HYPH|nr:BID domain-containing T4SS effector [Bartonella ancashensis]ALE03040.1 hypothetical protein PU02_0226 [Bartonella ancashensis]
MPAAKSLSRNYFYHGTRVLKNKYQTKNAEQLEKRMARDVANAILALQKEELPERFDASYIKHIHRCLFGKTFEWAGCTRDMLFKFQDGTSALMSKMGLNPDFSFVDGEKIQEQLLSFGEIIAGKNNLKGLSREEFVREVTQFFASLNWIHPFSEGNGRVQRLFFEKLAENAGHELDFSLVTNKRMTSVCAEAMENSNLEPMEHMFEDISDPKRRSLLKNFMHHATIFKEGILDTRCIVVAKEGVSISGSVLDITRDNFVINSNDTLIICATKDLERGTLKTLKKGDFVSLTPSQTPGVLIPERRMGPLSQSELSSMISQNSSVQECLQNIKRLSKIIYGNPEAVNGTMNLVLRSPHYAQQISERIQNDPKSIAKLAGRKFLCWKSRTRKAAERHVVLLSVAVETHGKIVTRARNESMEEHQQKQMRAGHAVALPSRYLSEFFSLSPQQRENALSQDPGLKEDFEDYVRSLNQRLSPNDRKAIREEDCMALSRTLDVSVVQAQKIVELVKITDGIKQELEHSASKYLTMKNSASKYLTMKNSAYARDPEQVYGNLSYTSAQSQEQVYGNLSYTSAQSQEQVYGNLSYTSAQSQEQVYGNLSYTSAQNQNPAHDSVYGSIQSVKDLQQQDPEHNYAEIDFTKSTNRPVQRSDSSKTPYSTVKKSRSNNRTQSPCI